MRKTRYIFKEARNTDTQVYREIAIIKATWTIIANVSACDYLVSVNVFMKTAKKSIKSSFPTRFLLYQKFYRRISGIETSARAKK